MLFTPLPTVRFLFRQMLVLLKMINPGFITITEILKKSVDKTVDLLRLELEIRKSELEEQWHFASLEKIFIEERIYKDKPFEDAASMDEAILHIDMRLEPFKPKFKREITREDILKLMEIKMGRILKFNTDKANEFIQSIEDEILEVINNINHIIPYLDRLVYALKNKIREGQRKKNRDPKL